MKLERRGKYPGVKLHLDGEECKKLLGTDEPVLLGNALLFPNKQGHFLAHLMEEVRKAIAADPTLLEERSEEEIKATLMKEFVESEKKLAHIKDGLDWKKVKVEVIK